ncbi:neutral zinc metallopeptidase [Kutzneria kofuensis]|uniref:Putative metalloprotease n=1 Tax=Kutzneria kofuensis TaxID=103725 RepID=A0A7W9KLZ0_9PSEU|nr:neutral zinc metallopeptidase [Kutzneria kofuensis]MBB5895001.1 putative metalloprotease [Kutzneria kofuensis]
MIRPTVASAAVVVLAAVAVLTAGCSTVVAGTGAVERPDPNQVAGLAVTTGDSGPRPGVADAGLPVANSDGSAVDKLAANAVADVQAFWEKELPADFGKEFAPVKGLVSYDSTGPALKVCNSSTAGLVNAFYCQADDSVSWDRGQLLPRLDDSFGPMAVVAVLAHELGHAVQFRLGSVNQATPTIVKEQQADCYAGTFFRNVAEGRSPHFQLSTGPGLNQILATLFFIRDSAGTSAQADGAHGDAFDRVTAFQLGFSNGAKRCAQIDVREVQNRITEQQFAPDDRDQGLGKGNLRVSDQSALRDLQTTLRAAFPRSDARIVAGQQSCSDAKTTSPAAYCPGTNTISLDLTNLVRIGTPPRQGAKGGIGDFAAFAEIASRFALAVEHSTGHTVDGPSTGQLTACLTGMWAGTITPGHQGALQLSPGDLDEAVAEMLMGSSLIAADVNGATVPSGFARVQAFRDGFTSAGPAICASKYGS